MTSLAWTFFCAISRSVRWLSARRIAASMSMVSGRKSGRSTGSIVAFQFGSCVPLTMSRLSASSVVRCVACAVDEVLHRRGRLGLCLDDVDRRHRADLHARLVVFDQLVGQVDRLPRDLHRLDGEHVVPVRVPHVRQRVGDRRRQLDVGDVAIQLGDLQLLTGRVGLEAPKQGLGILADQIGEYAGL